MCLVRSSKNRTSHILTAHLSQRNKTRPARYIDAFRGAVQCSHVLIKLKFIINPCRYVFAVAFAARCDPLTALRRGALIYSGTRINHLSAINS
jgi:hypothetical protein